MRTRNIAKTADGKEMRVTWKSKQWREVAQFFLKDVPHLCEYEELKGITRKDMIRMQEKIFAPELRRPLGGFTDMIGNRKKIRMYLNLIKAEAANPAVKASEEIVREMLPQVGINDVTKALAEVKDEIEYDEGESQLQFLPPISDYNMKPAEHSRFGSPELQKEILGNLTAKTDPKRASVTLPEPKLVETSEKSDMMSQIFSKPMSPKAALQAVGEMSMDSILNLLADKVADRVADRIAERIATTMLSKSVQAAPVKPAEPAPAVVKPSVKVDDRPTMRQQLADAVKQMPKPKKPKIAIIGMQGHQANEIQKEFPTFEIVHLLHGNDKIKDKVANVHKVLGVEAKLGNSAKMLRSMHGSNFVMIKFSMTSIRHQLGIWEVCHKEDPKYFDNVVDTQAA